MNMNEIILKKRDGNALSKEEITYFVKNYVDGNIPDYQVSALLMAIFFQGMNEKETFDLTDEMKLSGETIDLSSIKGIKVDKHSTGGVGDKTTFVVTPIAAAAGVPIAKMSGRALGFTGGTVDKMESIPGFRTALESNDFINQVNNIGISVIGQTANIAVADKKLYALRDVTGTVDNLSLISSSIMSKKLAAGSDAIVLDVKCGKGAFMKDLQNAQELGELMVKIGNFAGKKTVAAITDMNQPLGKAVGNSLEVIEAIETLKGKGPEDITELAIRLSGLMIYLGNKADSVQSGCQKAEEMIKSGKALEKMKEFIEAQGGNSDIIDNYELLPQASKTLEIRAEREGYIHSIDAQMVGEATQLSGAGRKQKGDEIDLSAGIMLSVKVGDAVKEGQLLFTIYGNDDGKINEAAGKLRQSFIIDTEKPESEVLIKKIIGI